MIKKRKMNEMTQIFELFSRVPSNYKYIAEQFKKYIEETGESFGNDPKIKSPIGFLFLNFFLIKSFFFFRLYKCNFKFQRRNGDYFIIDFQREYTI